jgi:hypothetical protein
MYSLPGSEDPVRKKLYRSFRERPTDSHKAAGKMELDRVLNDFVYHGDPLPGTLTLSNDLPVADYLRQFPGLDAGAKYNHAGFWSLPVPVMADIEVASDDVVIYDAALSHAGERVVWKLFPGRS